MKIAFYSSFRGSMTGGPQTLLNFLKHLPVAADHKLVISRAEDQVTEMAADIGCRTLIIGGLKRYAEPLHARTGIGRLALLLIPLELLQAGFRVFMALRREKPDLIWIRNVKTFLPVGIAALVSRTPLIWDIGMEKPSVGVVHWLHRLGFRMAAAVVVQGESVFRHTLPKALVQRFWHKCRVIPSGVDTELADRLEHGIRRSQGVDEFVILNSGTVCHRKNQEMLLEAVEPLLDMFPHVSVLLAGSESEPAYSDGLRTRYARLLATGRVRFLGWRDDMPELMGSAHLLAHMARNEGVPRAILEAFHSGLPVVATRAGGIPDVIEDGKTGYLVEVDDVPMLRERLIACIQQPELRAKLAANGRKVVKERYNLGRWLASYEKLFSEVMVKYPRNR
jgi:glycosyltransferase involved in cell wall biosynthesis